MWRFVVMKKIIVIGCPGSGKTTFCKKLAQKTNLPLFHLDSIWHKSDKSTLTKEEFDKIHGELLSKESWIIDGNYSRTLAQRVKACDTVILMDYSTEVCIQGITQRVGAFRSEMPWQEKEVDKEFYNYVLNFKTQKMPIVYDIVNQNIASKRLIIFTDRAQADEFLNNFNS